MLLFNWEGAAHYGKRKRWFQCHVILLPLLFFEKIVLVCFLPFPGQKESPSAFPAPKQSRQQRAPGLTPATGRQELRESLSLKLLQELSNRIHPAPPGCISLIPQHTCSCFLGIINLPWILELWRSYLEEAVEYAQPQAEGFPFRAVARFA